MASAIYARLPALEERPPMSLPRLCGRVARLEQDASRVLWWEDVALMLDRLMRQAGTAVGLTPASIQGLCTALHHTLEGRGQHIPRGVAYEQALDLLAEEIKRCVATCLDPDLAHVLLAALAADLRHLGQQAPPHAP